MLKITDVSEEVTDTFLRPTRSMQQIPLRVAIFKGTMTDQSCPPY